MVRIAVESTPPDTRPLKEPDPAPILAAVQAAGAVLTGVHDAEALVWLKLGDPGELARVLDAHPRIRWVQLPWAGVEQFAAAGVLDRPVAFTCAKASFAEQVGEHALTLILACHRHLVPQARTAGWHPIDPVSLFRRNVTILGAGGIAQVLIRLLAAFDCHVRVLRRGPGAADPVGTAGAVDPVDGADQTLPVARLHEVLPDTDVLVLALALTPETRGIIGAAELSLLPPHAVLVNVARGGHIDTEALTRAMGEGRIAAAALDVTDPEPLPAEHALWHDDRVLITSHCADGTDFISDMLARRVRTNIERFTAGRALIGMVDPAQGY